MRSTSLLDKIDSEALDGDLTKALRLCLKLGGEIGSAELREWATRELDGYKGVEIPSYRIIYAPLLIDGIAGNMKITGQSISSFDLPDFAQEEITDEVQLAQSVPTLIEVERDAQSSGRAMMSPPGIMDLVALMNSASEDRFHHINRIYWGIPRSQIQGVLENIRSKLVALMAEMRAGLEPGQVQPSPDIASQAVSIVVMGDKNRIITSQDTSQDTSTTHVGRDQKGAWRKALEVAGWLESAFLFCRCGSTGEGCSRSSTRCDGTPVTRQPGYTHATVCSICSPWTSTGHLRGCQAVGVPLFPSMRGRLTTATPVDHQPSHRDPESRGIGSATF